MNHFPMKHANRSTRIFHFRSWQETILSYRMQSMDASDNSSALQASVKDLTATLEEFRQTKAGSKMHKAPKRPKTTTGNHETNSQASDGLKIIELRQMLDSEAADVKRHVALRKALELEMIRQQAHADSLQSAFGNVLAGRTPSKK